jgi:hypothetical protein
MKKIALFLLFTLSILRGGTLVAQDCNALRYTISYSACDTQAVFSITYSNVGAAIYTFKLDSVASAGNRWQNVVSGWHRLSYSSNTGCSSRGDSIFYLSYNDLKESVIQEPRRCGDTAKLYRISAVGGHAPYTLKVDGVLVANNSLINLQNGGHDIKITDAFGCKNNSSYPFYAYYINPFVKTTSTFVRNAPCDSLGTFTIRVNDDTLPRPLSFSFNGRPFSMDSIFRNVNVENYRPAIIRTPQGCLYDTYINYYTPNDLAYTINYTSTCGMPAALSISYTSLSGATYTFRLDSVASATNAWPNVSPGLHRLGFTATNGCQSIDTVRFNLRTTNTFSYSAKQSLTAIRDCHDTLRC